MKEEIYISTDVESDGPIPGPNSMLSFASVAFRANKSVIDQFTRNLELLPGAVGDPNTMAWWKSSEPEAYAKTRELTIDPRQAMVDYHRWLKSLPGKPVFVGYPATYDFLFIYWYLMKFVGESPFSFSAIDIKTYAMAMLKTEFRETTKKRMPSDWFDEVPHTHVALDDAIEQGRLFINMLAKNTGRELHHVTAQAKTCGHCLGPLTAPPDKPNHLGCARCGWDAPVSG